MFSEFTYKQYYINYIAEFLFRYIYRHNFKLNYNFNQRNLHFREIIIANQLIN